MQVGRNDPCPCGSGKKYKKCCMRKDNIIQFKGLKRERFLQQKELLQRKLQDFLTPTLSFSEENRLMNQFEDRVGKGIDEGFLDVSFSIWLSFFHVYENGKRGLEWFFEQEQNRLTPEERAMAKQWTTLRPSVLQTVDKNEKGAWVEDYFSKERYFLPFVEMLTDLPPWATTFCMIEQSNDEYFVHGGAAWQGPEFLEPLSEKINRLVAESGNTREQVVMDYFPEIFSVLLKDPLGKRNNHAEKIESITLSYHLNDKKKVVDQLFDHPHLIVNEWADGEGSFEWMEQWYRYEDSEVPDPVYLGEVNGTIEVKDDSIKFQTLHDKDVERFQSWIGNLWDVVTFKDRSVETIDVPRKVDFHTLRVQMSEETPQYFAAFAQSRYYQDIDRGLPMFGNRSPRELVQDGEEKSVDLWLKQHEYMSYVNLRKQFGTTEQTDDLNSPRKELGLPLSPFVTGGKERHSSIHPCENPLQRSNRVKKEDIPYYQALGLSPETKDEFFARDVVEFFKERTVGKSKGTVQKYETSLAILVEYLLEDAPDITSWDECDVLVWEQLMAYDYLASYDDVSVSEAKSLFSTLKALARWLDRNYQMDLYAIVKPVASKFEEPVCDAIRFLDCYAPYYTRTSEVHDPFKNIAMVLERVAYPEKQFVEGLFQVTKITANGVRVVDLEDPGEKNYMVDLRSSAINMTHLGMILNGTLSRPKTGVWEISDLKEVFPGEAVDYLLH